MALVAIGKLISLSTDLAIETELLEQATQLCQAKLAEVVAGVVPLQSQADVPFDEDPDWKWSIQCDQSDVPNLWTVQVRVSRDRPNDDPIEFTVSQMIFDPTQRGSSIGSGGQSSGSSGSSSGGGTGP